MSSETAGTRSLLIGIGALVIGLFVLAAAGFGVLKFIDAQRASTYNSVQDDVDAVVKKTQQTQTKASRAAVVYWLQTSEASQLHENLVELAKFSTDYFSKDTLAELSKAADSLGEALEGTGLSVEENEIVMAEIQRTSADTDKNSTSFLNIGEKEAAAFVAEPEAVHVKRLPKGKVTKEAIEAARKDLADKKKDANIAQTELEVSEARAEALIVAIEGTLPVLTKAAKETPKQSKRMLKEYSRTKKDVAKHMRDSADAAVASIDAEQFVVEPNEIPVPLTTASPKEGEIQTATDAWRALIISRHLREYAKSITAAWMWDSKGSQGAAGFDPTRIFINLSGY